MTYISRLLSWLFIPLLAPVYALIITFHFTVIEKHPENFHNFFYLDDKVKEMVILLFALLSFIGPSLFLVLLKIRGVITTIMLDNREERIYPSVLINGFAVFLFCFIYFKFPPNFVGKSYFLGLSFGALCSVFIATIITFRWKISLHGTGMGILTGFVLSYYSAMNEFPVWVIPTLFLISGLVMTARLFLQKHTLEQCLAGFGVGFISTLTSTLLFVNYGN